MTLRETESCGRHSGKSFTSCVTGASTTSRSCPAIPFEQSSILDALVLPAAVINHQYTYIWVNRCYGSAYGKQPSDIVGNAVPEVWGWEAFRKCIKKNLDRCFQGEEVRQEGWIDFPALGRRYCETVYSPYSPEDTTDSWAIVVTYDLTERKRIEGELKGYRENLDRLVEERSINLIQANEELKAREEKYRQIFEDAAVGIYRTTPDGRFLMVNPYLAQLHGYENPEDFLRSITNIATQLYADPERRADFLALMEKDGIVRNFEMQARTKDGAIKHLCLNAHAVRDENGNTLWHDGVLLDITEKKGTQELVVRQRDLALKLAQIDTLEEGLTLIIQTAIAMSGMESGGIFLKNTETGGLVLVSAFGFTREFQERIRYVPEGSRHWKLMTAKESIHTRTSRDRTPVAFKEGFQVLSHMPVLEKGEVIGCLVIGSKVFVDVPEQVRTSLELLAAQSGNVIARIQARERIEAEVSIRRTAEKALQESEERYRIAIEHSNDGVVIDRSNEHLYVNRRYVEMFGYEDVEELIGKPVSAVVHADDLDRVTDITRRRELGEPAPVSYEFKARKRDGSPFYAEASVARIVFHGKPASLAYIRDITQRKHAEEVMLRFRREYELLTIARTKVIDRLAHEMKTPIAIIKANLNLLRKELGDHVSRSKAAFLERVEASAERLSNVAWDAERTFDVYRFVEAADLQEEIGWLTDRIELVEETPSRVRAQLNTLRESVSKYLAISEQSVQWIQVNTELRQIISDVEQQADRELSFSHRGDDDLQISMNRGVFRDIMYALLKNAVENTPDGGSVSVLFERKNGGAEIRVTDTGIGITEESQKYLFGGFFAGEALDFYSSGKPFVFGAGGRGLDPLRIKLYGRRYGLDISVRSRRCPHLPGGQDQCPGSIERCRRCSGPMDCLESGGTTFSLMFPDVRCATDTRNST